MERRKFTREFKVEAVKLVRERGVTVAQAARDLGVHGTVLRRWVLESAADASQAFPGQGQLKPDQLEIERLRREVTKLKAERDILKKPWPTSRRSRCEVWLHREAPGALANGVVMRGARCLAGWVLCVVDAATQPACSSRRGVGRQDPDEFPAERPDLRRETSVARPAGRG
jgi:transposase